MSKIGLSTAVCELSEDYAISRVIKGGWQLSIGHTIADQVNTQQAVNDILAYAQNGITTLDFGDIYLGVEELIGLALQKLRNEMGTEARQAIQLHTKYVPDIQKLSTHSFEDAEAVVHRSRKRLGVEYLDLVQFHWWDYTVPGYVESLQFLFKLKEQGYIRNVGVTNFDVPRLQEFVDAGIKPLTIQLQYSLLDRRPEHGMIEYCSNNDIQLLCYGTVAGGFLAERYLGIPEPESPMENRSLTKYKLIIDEAGGWDVFQKLLRALHALAQKYECSMSTIASAYILHRPQVAAVIVGARDRSHLHDNVQITDISLSDDDIVYLTEACRSLKDLPGDVYDLERTNPRHSTIMHKSNNQLSR